MLKTFSLQSGSNGNAVYVETPDTRLLFDAGISGRQADRRLTLHGRDIRQVEALIISHDHADHVRCAGIYQRKFGLPVFISEQTFAAARRMLGKVHNVRFFTGGTPMRFGGTTVHPIPTPHDATDGCCFVIEHGGMRLGLLTDLGHVFAPLEDALARLDAAYVESNYDPEMLASGPYPWVLQERIRGRGGHLSNAEAAHLVACCGQRLRWVALSHLSEQNNTPQRALDVWRDRLGAAFPLHLAGRYGPSDVLDVS